MKASSLSLRLGRIYRSYENILNRAQPGLLFVIRLTCGLLFLQTGWGKWHNLPKITAFFTDLGIPWPSFNAILVATTEFGGGLFLALGLLSRLTPIPLIITMLVAYLTTEQDALHALFSGNPEPFLSADPFLFLAASLIVLLFGPGTLAVDHLLIRKFFGSEK